MMVPSPIRACDTDHRAGSHQHSLVDFCVLRHYRRVRDPRDVRGLLHEVRCFGKPEFWLIRFDDALAVGILRRRARLQHHYPGIAFQRRCHGGIGVGKRDVKCARLLVRIRAVNHPFLVALHKVPAKLIDQVLQGHQIAPLEG